MWCSHLIANRFVIFRHSRIKSFFFNNWCFFLQLNFSLFKVQKFREYFRKAKLHNVEVKSVEEFQGQERKVVIISTVRSQQKFVSSDYQFGLGFLRNPKVRIFHQSIWFNFVLFLRESEKKRGFWWGLSLHFCSFFFVCFFIESSNTEYLFVLKPNKLTFSNISWQAHEILLGRINFVLKNHNACKA